MLRFLAFSSTRWTPKDGASSERHIDEFKIDGVLSAKFFEHHVVTLDFKRRELVLENKQTLNRRLRQGHVIPLKVMADRNKALGLFVDLRAADTLTCECELDTGFDSVLILDIRFMKPLSLDENSASVNRIESNGITGLAEVRYQATVPNISLSDASAVKLKIGW